MIACHCGQCRKTSGHHVSATSARRDEVEVTGEVAWFNSSRDARRGFCDACGSNLFWDGPGTHLSIMAGTLDSEPPDLRLAGHIFVADKGRYYEIADGLPQAEAADPDLTTRVRG